MPPLLAWGIVNLSLVHLKYAFGVVAYALMMADSMLALTVGQVALSSVHRMLVKASAGCCRDRPIT